MAARIRAETAYRAALNAWDMSAAIVTGSCGPAHRSADHTDSMGEQVANRCRYFESLAARLGLHPERAAELLRERES